MNLSFTPEIERWINDRVKTGRYTGASELVREAIRRLMDYESTQQAHREKLELAIDEARTAIKRGHGLTRHDLDHRHEQRKADWLKKNRHKHKAA